MGHHADVATLARQAADRQLSGSVELHPKGVDGAVTLYFYEGRLYALHGAGCVPQVARRLVATGTIDETTVERMRLDAAGDNGHDDAEVGKAAVRAGLVPVERLAALHQEFLLAAFGALRAGGAMKATVRDRARTSAYCALPAPVEDIVATVAARTARTATAWQTASGDAVFTDRLLRLSEPGIGNGMSGLRLPEADAIRAAVAADPQASVDSVAAAVGLTRAEAVHLVAQLAQCGEVVIGETVTRASGVPEALLDPKPAEPKASEPKPERRHRGWFRQHAPQPDGDSDSVDTPVNADIDAEPAEAAIGLADTVTDASIEPRVESGAETADEAPREWAAPLIVIETVDATAVGAAEAEVAGVIALAEDMHVADAHVADTAIDDDPADHVLADQDLEDVIDVRVVDANTLAAVRARLDAIVVEIDDLRRLLDDLEAGR